jgi:sugar transferase (PEP-CTERM system associated)
MFPLLRHRLTPRVLFTLVFELVAISAGLIGLLKLRSVWWDGVVQTSATRVCLFALSTTLVIQFGLWSFGLYSRQVVYSGRRVLASLLGAFCFLTVALFPVCYAFSMTGDPIFVVTLKFYVLLLAVFTLVVACERFLVLRVFAGVSYLGNVLILGTGECTREVIREARKHHGMNMRLAGILAESPDQIGQAIEGVPVIGMISHVKDTVADLQVRSILLSSPYNHPQLPLDYLIECKLSGLTVFDAGVFYETISQKILLEKLDPFTLLFPSGYNMTRFRHLVKAGIEKLLALILLGVLGLPLLFVAFLIRKTSAGPAIFRQIRVGKGGRVFTLYKFRTMCVDAEQNTGAQWARKGDPRQTLVGKWLRRLRIDELPQLVNILKGDMAFIGPRPERPEFIDELKRIIPFYHHRHFVKPGLTGWAQVSFPYAASMEDSKEKLRYDLYYVKNMSILFDMLILLATARAVIRGAGVG